MVSSQTGPQNFPIDYFSYVGLPVILAGYLNCLTESSILQANHCQPDMHPASFKKERRRRTGMHKD
jgi:hypothetical protein